MDIESLRRLSGLQARRGRNRRIQRQVHVRAVGAARRILRHACRPRARELSQLLLSRGALAVLGNPPGEGRMSASPQRAIRLHDRQPVRDRMREDVLHGLRRRPKRLPSKYFYDARGSELFERICEQPEYYLTRLELAILREHIGDIAGAIGPDALLMEYGSGNGLKTRLLLKHMDEPVAYMPVEIAREALLESIGALAEEFPDIELLPVCADFTGPLALPRPQRTARRTVAFFPGSTIGNFETEEAVKLLRQMRAQIGREDRKSV